MEFDDQERLWSAIIYPAIREMLTNYPGLSLNADSKRRIFNKYHAVLEHCKVWYMENDKETARRLDRHKVAAAFMIAIIQTKPICLTDQVYCTNAKRFTFNESVAMKTAFSILRAFLLTRIKKGELISSCDDSKYYPIIESYFSDSLNEFIYPAVNHDDDYSRNLALALSYCGEDAQLNILILANILFLIEAYTVQRIIQSSLDQ